MANSPLVNCTKLSPMCSSPRNHRIDTITIHHMAGNLSAETCGQVFQTRQASSNYGVDSNGRVGLYVDEGDRSWASANPANVFGDNDPKLGAGPVAQAFAFRSS